MITDELKIRVRYAETDNMGFVYYGNYAIYYEIARTELTRNMGLTYKEMEKDGVFVPVNLMEIKYIKSARYDDLLTIKSVLKERPGLRMVFRHEIYNEDNELINIGKVSLVFIDAKTGKPRRPSERFEKVMDKYFK